jgi:gamma-glutamylcyclotransferase (GGCT)/AIG2-like uncharacterized protein YtfP
MNPALDRLFVYGTLLNSGERSRLLGRSIDSYPARLEGYERGRRRHFYVAARKGGVVEGAILSGLGERDLAILDEYEEVPHLYSRVRVVANDCAGAALECWIYLPTGWELDRA